MQSMPLNEAKPSALLQVPAGGSAKHIKLLLCLLDGGFARRPLVDILRNGRFDLHAGDD